MLAILSIVKSAFQLSNVAKYVTYAAIFALATAGTYYWHHVKVKEFETEIHMRIAKESQRNLDQLTIKSQKIETDLKVKIKEIELAKQNEKRTSDARVNSLLASLRDRPQGRTGEANLPGNTSVNTAPKGATGLQLARPDAEFLARFTGMGSELQAELKGCLVSYEDVRTKLEKFKKDNP